MQIVQTTEQTPTLTQDQVQYLAAVLSTYRSIKQDADLLNAQLKEEAAKVFAILEAEGIAKVEIDGIPCTIVGGFSSKLDKVDFVARGGDLAMLDAATKKKPKKKYVKITLGDEEEEAA